MERVETLPEEYINSQEPEIKNSFGGTTHTYQDCFTGRRHLYVGRCFLGW